MHSAILSRAERDRVRFADDGRLAPLGISGAVFQRFDLDTPLVGGHAEEGGFGAGEESFRFWVMVLWR